MSRGYVYILSNPSMPGMVKIGRTTRSVESRSKELFQTGVPTTFDVVAEVYSPDCRELESAMHQFFSEKRVSSAREFFAVDGADASTALRDLHREQVEEWVESFVPNEVLVPGDDHMVDPSTVAILADRCGATLFEVTCALDMMEAEDFAPALTKWRTLAAKRGINRNG